MPRRKALKAGELRTAGVEVAPSNDLEDTVATAHISISTTLSSEKLRMGTSETAHHRRRREEVGALASLDADGARTTT